MADAENLHLVYTSVNFDYLPRAGILAKSIKLQDPSIRFVALIVEPTIIDSEQVKKDILACPAFRDIDEILTLSDLSSEINRAVEGLSITEACTAVKADAMLVLLARKTSEYVTYIDPDIFVYDTLQRIRDEHKKGEVLLTPHLLHPPIREISVINHEIAGVLKHGIFNLGFISCKKSELATRVISWWSERLKRYCRADYSLGVWTDQKWFDLTPVYFPEIHVVRDLGWNVAPWNNDERRLVTINPPTLWTGDRLLFHHFSKFPDSAFYNSLQNGAWPIEYLELAKDYETVFRNAHEDQESRMLLNKLKTYRVSIVVKQSPRIETLVTSCLEWIRSNRFSRSTAIRFPGLKKYAVKIVLRAERFLYSQQSNQRTLQIDSTNSPKMPLVNHLIISHYGGGGVDVAINSYLDTLPKDLPYGILRPTTSGTFKIKTSNNVEYVLPNMESAIQAINNADSLAIHHVLGVERLLPHIIQHRSKTVFLHDRYLATQFPFADTLQYLEKRPSINGIDLPLNVLSSFPESEWLKNSGDLLTSADRVMAPSTFIQKEFNLLFPEIDITRMEIEKSAALTQLADQTLEPFPRISTIAIISPTGPHKGVEVVKNVARLLIANGSTLRLIVFGDLRAKDEEELGALENVSLVGQVPRSRIQEYLLRTPGVIGWIPSLTGESFSLSLSDFLATGTRVLASKVGALPERLSNLPGHLLYEPQTRPGLLAADLDALTQLHPLNSHPLKAAQLTKLPSE